MNLAVALIAVTERGLERARLLRARLKTGIVHRPERYGAAAADWDQPFRGPLSKLVPDLFERCDQLVFFLAVGAVTRLLAPCLVSKTSDPGVLAVDEAGQFVVPVLSGHVGGANAFARTVAGCLGAVPVITTASDVVGGLSLDVLAEEFGWSAEPSERLTPAARALVERESVAIVQDIGTRGQWLDERELPDHVVAVRDARKLPEQDFAQFVWVSDRLVAERAGLSGERILWLRPKSLVLGVGCERGISRAALDDGLERFLQQARYARSSISQIASVDLKTDETGLVELANAHGWQTVFYSAEELARVADIPNPSAVVEKCVGTPGVAEPAALLASGADRLLIEKQVLDSTLSPQRMTFALARRAEYSTSATATGQVVFLGAGPGDPDLLTIKGRNYLRRADVIVYAGSLVPEAVLRHAPATAQLHNSAHLTLEQIMTCLIEAARAGKRVVRVHSGDTSLYSAIQEQQTLLDDAEIGYSVVPGISAFQAAAAALGSELTLPEVVQTIILTRGEGTTSMPAGESLSALAAHRATLCIFLSARLGESVQKQLLSAYPPETPTAICYRVSWPDEKIIVTELGRLAEELRRHGLVRTTLILVGEAVGGRRNRSRLYDEHHAHIFRPRRRSEDRPAAERDA